jgi:hypothetical protein
MNRFFYSSSIHNFLNTSTQEIFGTIAQNSGFSDEFTQKEAWSQEITILKQVLNAHQGTIFFEYSIPRMGRRIDVVLVINNAIFVIEFKVGEKEFLLSAIDQVWDYALDLKNFHEASHSHLVAPVLVATEAPDVLPVVSTTAHSDNMLFPIKTNRTLLLDVIEQVLKFSDGNAIDAENWSKGRYSPTPTIIEAAMSLYNEHGVKDIYRNDASAINLTETSNAVLDIIVKAKTDKHKAICFVTGVPGAGKTLVGLNIGAKNFKENEKSSTVFLGMDL